MAETGFDTNGAPRPGGHGTHGDWWARRPRRSATDRKIAGVAGGLGRHFGIDPVLIRVAFAVLALFGGSGVLLYSLGWLLLASDGDEVSPGEALLGKGRSSASPVLAVGLGVVAVISLFSVFSWGLPFIPAPVVIAVVILVLVMRRRGRTWTPSERQGFMDKVDRSVQDLSERASRIGSTWGSSQPPQGRSPFDSPAFWERDGQGHWRRTTPAGTADDLPAPSADQRVDGPAPTSWSSAPAPSAAQRVDAPAPDDLPPSPPAWDPLGVAPFAWDLPEPTPLAGPAPAPARVRGKGVIGRVTMGAALIAGGLAAAGVFAGWWALSWAQVSAIALAVVAIGLLIAALRGRTAQLIGPGIFLSLVTIALTVTGISGTSGYGEQNWVPLSADQVQPSYQLNGGQGTLDLTQVAVKSGQTLDIDVDVKAGHAEVILPANTNYVVECSANAGRVDCLDSEDSGWKSEGSATETRFSDKGTIHLDVQVGAGYAEVHHG